MVTFNFETFEVRLDRLDGMVGTATLPRPEGYEPGPLREMSFSPSLHFMSFTTVQGDDVHVEMPKFGDAEQLAGRVVVYLDQCIWRRISDAHHAPVSGAEDAERAAARRLIELVDRRAVVLPLSAGHHHEVTAWSNDEQRYLLGLAMLRVSRGWQMRDPLTLRREEYRAAFYRQMRAVPLVAAAEAFTLLPNVTVREPSPAEVPADFDAEATHVMQTLGYFQAIVSTILDSRPIPASTQRLGWVDANQQLSDWLVTETGRTSAQKRKSVDVVLLNDLSQELAEEAHQVGMLPSQL